MKVRDLLLARLHNEGAEASIVDGPLLDIERSPSRIEMKFAVILNVTNAKFPKITNALVRAYYELSPDGKALSYVVVDELGFSNDLPKPEIAVLEKDFKEWINLILQEFVGKLFKAIEENKL
jgi:hypothetical protein